MANGTSSNVTMAVPTAEGITDGLEAIVAAAEAGKWTLIAPDGRVWMNPDPAILCVVLAQIMQGRPLLFGEH